MSRMKNCFLITFFGSATLAVFAYFTSTFIEEAHHGCLLIGFAAFMLGALLSYSAFNNNTTSLMLAAIGSTWGFLFATSVMISIQNGRISVNWQAMAAGLIAIPFVIFLIMLPIRYIRMLFDKSDKIKSQTSNEMHE